MKIENNNFLFLADETDIEIGTQPYDYSSGGNNVDVSPREEMPSGDATAATAQQPVQEIPVTRKDIDAYRKEMDTQVAKLTTQIQTAGSINSTVGYVSIGAISVALLACIILIVVRSTLLNRINDLTRTISAQHSEIEKLSSEVAELTNSVGVLKNKNYTSRQVNEDFELPTVSKLVNILPETEKFNNSQPRPVVQADKFSNFVQEFNSLARQTGYDARKAADEFTRKFNIQAFNCTNFEARMSEPVPPPIFGSATSLQNADYWAYEFESGVYAVVPRVKSYTDNHHTARAMGEIFKSNFSQGGTYSKIVVAKPAIFKGNWNLETQGELQLG